MLAFGLGGCRFQDFVSKIWVRVYRNQGVGFREVWARDIDHCGRPHPENQKQKGVLILVTLPPSHVRTGVLNLGFSSVIF